MLDFVRADLARARAKDDPVPKVALVLFNLGVQAVLLYRLARWFHTHGMPHVGAVISYANSVFTGAQISARATIGKGLVVYHPRGVVVGATSVIGETCTLVHDNLIGQLQGGGDRPVIGNNFFAATGSKIMGRITIGDDVSVGPNSVVMRSLPAGVTVSGIPARIVFRRTEDALAVDVVDLSRDAVVDRVVVLMKRTLEATARTGNIDESTPLLGKGVGIDSIDVLRLVCALEEEFNMTLEESELAVRHLRSVGTLADFIVARIGS
jgi:serine O-acetyltransferase